MNIPKVKSFFDKATFTVTHIIIDDQQKQCAIMDSVLDYDHSSGRTDTRSADQLIKFIKTHELDLKWILETHVHADHITAAPYLQSKLGGNIGIGAHIPQIQNVFAEIFQAEDSFARDGSQFDRLFADGETFHIGGLDARIIYTPGHTPACVSYLIGDALFVGDTLFMPDYGSARCDFPGGDAGQLYDSVHRLFELPEQTRMFLCHDYKAPGRDEFRWETTIGEQKRSNIHLNTDISRAEFIKNRTTRDKTLNMPKLILPSIQVNMRAGHFPPSDDNGKQFLKIPINTV